MHVLATGTAESADAAIDATGAIAHIAGRTHATEATTALCALVRDSRALVRANALAGLALDGARCGTGSSSARSSETRRRACGPPRREPSRERHAAQPTRQPSSAAPGASVRPRSHTSASTSLLRPSAHRTRPSPTSRRCRARSRGCAVPTWSRWATASCARGPPTGAAPSSTLSPRRATSACIIPGARPREASLAPEVSGAALIVLPESRRARPGPARHRPSPPGHPRRPGRCSPPSGSGR